MSRILKKKEKKSGYYYRRLKEFTEMYNNYGVKSSIGVYQCNASLG